jgi:hypothetical protein
MGVFQITSPNTTYSGETGHCQFSKGLYRGTVKAGTLSYFAQAGYKLELTEGDPDGDDFDVVELDAGLVLEWLRAVAEDHPSDIDRLSGVQITKLALEDIERLTLDQNVSGEPIEAGEDPLKINGHDRNKAPDAGFDPQVDPFAGQENDPKRPPVNDPKDAWVEYVVALSAARGEPITAVDANKLTKNELMDYQPKGDA